MGAAMDPVQTALKVAVYIVFYLMAALFLAPLLLHTDILSKLPSAGVARKSKALEKEGNR